MSELRRRMFGSLGAGDSSPGSSRDVSPCPPVPSPNDDGEDYRIVSAKKLEKLSSKVKRKGAKRRNAWMFALGGLVGVMVAGFFASDTAAVQQLVEVAGLKDMNLDSILDVLPAGLIKEVQNLQVSQPALLVEQMLPLAFPVG